MIAFARPAEAALSSPFNDAIERMYFPGNGNGDLRRSEYDVTKATHKRRSVAISTKSEDEELPAEKRAKLVSLGHDARRNMAIAAWAIRKHLDYVARFNFKGRMGDKAVDGPLEAFVARWSKKEAFDVARRHPRDRWLRLVEAARTLNGDIGILKLATKQVQSIEGDRIRNYPALPVELWTHGVRCDVGGAAVEYAVGKRKKGGGGFEFERKISADNLILHGYFDRFDQVRGISPMAAALDPYRDVYEAGDLALAKMKAEQLFALAIFSDVAEEFAPEAETTDEDEAEESSDGAYKVDFGAGPQKLELRPGDKAEFLQSSSPSSNFQAFLQATIGIALKALDIPYSFYDEAHTNYSGARQALLMYEESAESKRQENRELLDALTTWRLGLAVLDGELELPAGVEFTDLKWEWVSTGIPWIDPLKEVNADTAARNSGFDSTVAICKRAGTDAYELAEEEAAYQEHRKQLGLPHSLVEPGAVTINEVQSAQ